MNIEFFRQGRFMSTVTQQHEKRVFSYKISYEEEPRMID